MALNTWFRRLQEVCASKLSARRSRAAVHRTAARNASSRLHVEALEERAVFADLSNYVTTEHVDLNIVSSGGGFTISPRNDDAVVSYAPEDVLLYVGVGEDSGSLNQRPASPDFDFIGVGANEEFYRLPQSQNPNLLYLGFAGYGVDPNSIDRYNPSAESGGRVSGLGRWLKVSLVDVQHTTPGGDEGTGVFSVWQSGDSGPNVFMSNYDDGVAQGALDTTDGVTGNDALWIVAGGHIHYNFGFTEKGRYEVTVMVSAYANDGNTTELGTPIASQPITLYFSVGSVGQLEFDESSYTVDEDAGTATITVHRVNGSDGEITVNYGTSNGTATSGVDYTTTLGSLTFADGETQKTIAIPILDDLEDEVDETITLTLSVPGPTNIAEYIASPFGDDSSLLGSNATATLTILDDEAPANTPPTIAPIDDQTTNEDVAKTVDFTVGDAETAAADLIITATSSNTTLVPTAGLVVAGTGVNRTLTITPSANLFGTTTITIKVRDADGSETEETFDLTVEPVNDVPVANAQSVNVSEDQPTVITLTGTDADGQTLTYTIVNPPLNGVLSGSGAELTYTPNTNYIGPDSFTFTVSDGTAVSAPATVDIAVAAANDPPVISAIDDVVMDEDGDVTINFTISDEETAASSLVVTRTSDDTTLLPTSRLTLGGSGANRTLRIRPSVNQNGEAFVTLTVRDAGNATTSVTFKVTVNAVNDPPIAVDDEGFFVHLDTATVLPDVLANDLLVDVDQTAAITSFTQPTNGALTQNENGRLVYTPNADFRGFDEFSYTITDGDGQTDTATVQIAVGVVDLVHTDLGVNYISGEWYLNIQPDFNPATEVDSDEAVLFANPNSQMTLPALPPSFEFIGADEGDTIWMLTQTQSVDSLWLGFSNEGTASGLLASSIRLDLVGYDGPGHFSLFDTGSFGDPHAWIDTADGLNSTGDSTVGGNSADFYTVLPGSHSHLNWTFTEAGRYTLTFRATAQINTTDAAGNPTVVTVVSPLTTYTIDVNSIGAASLTESPPLARDDAATVLENSANTVIDVLNNDSSSPDPNESLAVTGVTQGTNGTVAISEDGLSVTYTPNANYFGTDQFTYTITDEHGGVATATVSVTVSGGNEAPLAADDAYTVSNGNAVHGNVLHNDSDADGDELAATLHDDAAHGTVVLHNDGSFTYTPGTSFAGSDSFTYQVVDAHGETSLATVTITSAGFQEFEGVISEGHTDVGVAYEDGWDLHVHDEENDVEYEPNGALIYVGPNAETTRPVGDDFAFIGVEAGEAIYRIRSDVEQEGIPYLGLGTEEIEPGTFTDGLVRLTLKAVNGPGNFAMWRDTDSGPEVLMATADGITAADMATLLEGGHTHVNWAFTAAGRYEITFQAWGYLDDGDSIPDYSEDVTYYFSVDNLGTVQLDSSAYTVGEGGTATITLERSRGSDGPMTVNYGTTGGTASSGVDYPVWGGSVTFADGETSKTITFSTTQDSSVEPDETVSLQITAPDESLTAIGALDSAELTITNDDETPLITLSISSPSFNEGDFAVVTATLPGVYDQDVTVHLNFSGTAGLGADYTAPKTFIVIPAGATTATLTLTGVVDGVSEGDESIAVSIAAIDDDAQIGGQQVTATIGDHPMGTVVQSLDPDNPGKFIVTVYGTHANDKVSINKFNLHSFQVVLNGVKSFNYDNLLTTRVVVYGFDGNDSVKVATYARVDTMQFGGNGNDTLYGGRQADLIVGGAGNDKLKGGRGRDILIGGDGADKLYGSYDDDVVIGNRTAYDGDVVALRELLKDWNAAGVGNSFAERVARLRTSSDYSLSASTVLNDGVRDSVQGNYGVDWFLDFAADASLRDKFTVGKKEAKN